MLKLPFLLLSVFKNMFKILTFELQLCTNSKKASIFIQVLSFNSVAEYLKLVFDARDLAIGL